MAWTRENNHGIAVLIIGMIFLMLAIVYLTSWKKENISVKMLVKTVIVQFLIVMILVKVPAGRYAVSKVSGAVTSAINYGQDGLSLVFDPLTDNTAVVGSVFVIQVLGNIVSLSILMSFLYYTGILGFVVRWVGKAVGKLMGISEVENFVAIASMSPGQTDSPAPVGSIMVARMLLPQTEEVQEVGSAKMNNKGNNTNTIETVVEGAVTGMQMALSIGIFPVVMVVLVVAVDKLLGVYGIGLQQVFSYVFAPPGFFLGLDPLRILLEGNPLGSKLVLNELVAFQQLGGMISSMNYKTGMMFAISLCSFASFLSLGICVPGVMVLRPEKKSTLACLVFEAMLDDVAAGLISAMTVGLVT